MLKTSPRFALLRLFVLSLVLTWGQIASAQIQSFTLSGAGESSVNQNYQLCSSLLPNDPTIINSWLSSDGQIGVASQAVDGRQYLIVWHLSGGVPDVCFYIADLSDLGNPTTVDPNSWQGAWNYYSGTAPPPAVSAGGGVVVPTGSYPTNNVYILGGTNSSIIINDGTHPIPITLPDSINEQCNFAFKAGLFLGCSIVAFCFALSILRAVVGGNQEDL